MCLWQRRTSVMHRSLQFDAIMEGALRWITGMSSSKTVKQHACRIDHASKQIVFEESAQALDVPMGDTFKIQTLWKITPASPVEDSSTHVRVMTSVVFVKPVKFIQGQITSASVNTMEEATAQFVDCCTNNSLSAIPFAR